MRHSVFNINGYTAVSGLLTEILNDRIEENNPAFVV